MLIANGLLRWTEGLAIGLTRPALCSPPVKQRRVVHELQQGRSNFLCFRHSFVHGIKASFLECTSGIGHVSQPTDVSIAHTKPHLADIQDVSITRLRGSGEGSDAPQISFRAVLSVEAVQIIRTVRKRTVRNYCDISQLWDVETLILRVARSLLLWANCSNQRPTVRAVRASEHKPP